MTSRRTSAIATLLLGTALVAACGREPSHPDRDGAATVATVIAKGAPEDTPEAQSIGFAGPAPAPAPPVAAEGRAAAKDSPPVPSGPDLSAADASLAPMLIRSGDASLEVDSLERAVSALQALAARTGAQVGGTTMRGGRETVRTATLEIRIPAARFDDLVSGLAPLGRVEHVNVHAQDVTEEYVDLAARVANARRLEERLVRLLATRTGRLEDVLAVERELARVREEIERHEGRLRWLRTRSAISTLAVTMHERAPLVATHPGANPIRDALVEAWRRFVATTAGVIVAMGALLPVVLVVLAGGVVAYGARRRYLRREAATPARPAVAASGG